jgi:hypothetical protein
MVAATVEEMKEKEGKIAMLARAAMMYEKDRNFREAAEMYKAAAGVYKEARDIRTRVALLVDAAEKYEESEYFWRAGERYEEAAGVCGEMKESVENLEKRAKMLAKAEAIYEKMRISW